jgi:glutamine amidotransferase
MKTVVIDYGAGNVESVFNALSSLQNDNEILISNNPKHVRLADYLVLPGVGDFGDCMNGLKSVEGLLSELKKQVLVKKKPFLGICVGMQVLASIGFENGEHQGLDFINGRVEKIMTKQDLKIPHMGWNEISIKNQKHSVLKDLKDGEHFYFANSYHFICQNQNNILAQVEYGDKMNAIIVKENILGVQFHPEKSGKSGLLFLKNFLNWREYAQNN